MKRNRLVLMRTRLPQGVVDAIREMTTPQYSISHVLRDIVVASLRSAQQPLREETIALLCRVVEAAGYGSADALVQDLCLAFERCLLQARGELNEEEVVNVDIADMFDAITDKRLLSNEEGVRIRKHT